MIHVGFSLGKMNSPNEFFGERESLGGSCYGTLGAAGALEPRHPSGVVPPIVFNGML